MKTTSSPASNVPVASRTSVEFVANTYCFSAFSNPTPKIGLTTRSRKRTCARKTQSWPWRIDFAGSPSGPSKQALEDLGAAVAEAVRRLGRRDRRRLGAVEVGLEVPARHLVRLADEARAAALEQHRALAEAHDGAHVVGDEQHRLALVPQAVELVEALLLERGVADREHLVDQQHVGVDLDRDREGEPDLHARRVVLQLEVDELVQLGELEHGLEPLARRGWAQAEHDAVDEHVVARREIRVEADAELDEGREAAVDQHPAGVGTVDPGEALEQRALARPVAADDAEELAPRDT